MASGAIKRLVSGSAEVGGPCRLLAVCGFLVLAVITVFGQTVGHDFVNYDDGRLVYENPVIAAASPRQALPGR